MKVIKMYIVIFLVFFNVSFLFGRGSVPEPNSEQQSLVIGQIIQQGSGYRLNRTISVNGTNKEGIEITIQELVSGQTYTMRTQYDGMFFSVYIPEGQYKINSFFLKKEAGRSWSSISWTPQNIYEYRFEIKGGKVYNFGSISWECENNVKNLISINREYEQVTDYFQENNPSSAWNKREWENINIKREIK